MAFQARFGVTFDIRFRPSLKFLFICCAFSDQRAPTGLMISLNSVDNYNTAIPVVYLISEITK